MIACCGSDKLHDHNIFGAILACAVDMDQLQKLDELLLEHPSSMPSYSADLNDEEYTVQQKQWHKRVGV